MAEAVQTVSGIPVTPAAAEVAKAVAEVVRDVAAGLPFGTEPGEFLVALERLAEPEQQA